jgi:radical SAM superfamily enzyme YgiQ (UPF0313 family)
MLLVYPEFSPTYWGLQYTLPLLGRKAVMPPLGLLTIAALTPDDYRFRLVDLNCRPLADADLAWADLVLISAMLPQKSACFRVADAARRAGKLVVLGGPFPTACPDECSSHCDVLVLNEGEVTWPQFLRDLAHGHFQHCYTSEEKPDLTKSPCPSFDLVDVGDYAVMPVQFSRGCPYRCEFCDIIVMFGRVPRTKQSCQLLRELDAIHARGYRGLVFIVDDNFIGDRRKIMALLEDLQAWNEARGHPFHYSTEVSVNVADDEPLMAAMQAAGLVRLFIGIETPAEESLKETKKVQNLKGSLLERVRAIQRAGFSVNGGFILGFDQDPEDIFERQMQFINAAAIPGAMVGPLVALPKTPLYERLKREGRLLEGEDDIRRTVASGFTNINTRIPLPRLLAGYGEMVRSLYTPRNYLRRSLVSLRQIGEGMAQRTSFALRPAARGKRAAALSGALFQLRALWRMLRQMPAPYRWPAAWFALRVLLERPQQFGRATDLIVIGYHYYMFTFRHVLPEVARAVEDLSGRGPRVASGGEVHPGGVREDAAKAA